MKTKRSENPSLQITISIIIVFLHRRDENLIIPAFVQLGVVKMHALLKLDAFIAVIQALPALRSLCLFFLFA